VNVASRIKNHHVGSRANAKVSNFAPTLFKRGRRAAAIRNRASWGEYAA
jgi:hypothetical protein